MDQDHDVAASSTMVLFDEAKTVYHGRREKVAVMVAWGVRSQLSLADTARCAADPEAARLVLVNVFGRVMVPHVDDVAPGLVEHCRKLTKWKERKPRY